MLYWKLLTVAPSFFHSLHKGRTSQLGESFMYAKAYRYVNKYTEIVYFASNPTELWN